MDIQPPYSGEPRKESPGEFAQKWGGFLSMWLKRFDIFVTQETMAKIVEAVMFNYNRWKRKYG